MGILESKTTMPEYMKSFKCIASLCEDSCCEGWKDIFFDRVTYGKYKDINDLQITEILDKNIIPVEYDQVFCAKFDLLANSSSCPFLTDEQLCLLQVKMGQDYLPYICAAYPRITNVINDKLEKSAILSCPEACRAALLNPGGIDFIRFDEPDGTRNLINTVAAVGNAAPDYSLNRYFYEIRIFSAQIIKNRNYSLQERLLTLGLFSLEAAQYQKDYLVDKIPALIETYNQKISKNSLSDTLSRLPSDFTSQFILLINLISDKIFMDIVNHRFQECIKEFLTGIEYEPELGLGKAISNYRSACLNYYMPFMLRHQYILENYVINYIFLNIFPFSTIRTIFDQYTVLILHYSLIKLFLIGMSQFHKGLTEELTVKLIQSFTKTIDHDVKFINQMFNSLVSNGYNSINYMSMLIKN